MKLAPQPGYIFVPVLKEADTAPLAAYSDVFEFYDVALNVGEPVDVPRLRALMEAGEVYIWRIEPDGARGCVGYALRSGYAMAEQVYVLCLKGWDNTVVAAGMEALTQAIFLGKPSCQNIYTCIPLPEPEDSEETLTIMGFTYVPASLDKNRRRTFGLSREIFEAYHEA